MKCISKIILISVMMCYVYITGAVAHAQFSVSDAQVYAGDEVSVDVSVTNNPSFAAMTVDIEYDKAVFTVKDVKSTDLLNGQLVFNPEYGEEKNIVRVVFAGVEDIENDGVLYTIVFSTDENASAGESKLKAGIDFLSNDEYEELKDIITDGAITVKERKTSSSKRPSGGGGSSSVVRTETTPTPVLTPAPTATPAPTIVPEVTQSPQPLPEAAYDEISFDDVLVDDWFYKSVTRAVALGFFKGTSATDFSPYENITRGMLVTVIGRIEGVEETTVSTSSYKDVDKNAYYAPYIEWMSKQGIVNGVGEGLFAPDEKITREQMAVITANYAKYKGKQLVKAASPQYSDYGNVSLWAKESVNFVSHYGLMNGTPEGAFLPQGFATRAEAAEIICRIYDLRNI